MTAEFESELIWMRTREGMKVAKTKGRPRGEPPKLSPTQAAQLVKLYRAAISKLEELSPATRATFYRAAARAGGQIALAPAGDTADAAPSADVTFHW
ncbi:MAG: hypothetical protein QOK16_4819 [Solirubrobacteraceae bacterium]|jgi:DNA invertase Pin-like site-specific DNA recombinase|nr:hypothetical protein [Solirubrobacteraceae bacterium]